MSCVDDCWSDHRFIRSTIHSSIWLAQKRRVQRNQSCPKLNVKWLNDTTYEEQLEAVLCTELPKQYPVDTKTHWGMLKSSITNSIISTLGHITLNHQDWFDGNDTEIQQLIDIKRQGFTTWQSDINCKIKC